MRAGVRPGIHAMNAPVLPGPLADNPRLDRWVTFPAPGKVTVGTGRVELGQGVLTAMTQIAADELDVAMERITIRSGDTEFTPNEGYTAGSQSIQFGGVAMRQACADVRGLFIDRAAKRAWLQGRRTQHSRRHYPSQRRTDRPGLLDARGRGRPRHQRDRRRQAQGGRGFRQHRPQQRAPRSAGKDFWQAGLHPRHGARRHGACAGRAPAQPRRCDRRQSTNRRSSAPPRRRSNSCATAISSPSSATTRPPSTWPAPPRPITSPGNTSRRQRRFRTRRPG